MDVTSREFDFTEPFGMQTQYTAPGWLPLPALTGSSAGSGGTASVLTHQHAALPKESHIARATAV